MEVTAGLGHLLRGGTGRRAGRGGLGALGEKQQARSLLLREANPRAAGLHCSARRVEFETPEEIAARPAGSSLNETGREVRVDVRHGHVAFDEIRARAELVRLADRG